MCRNDKVSKEGCYRGHGLSAAINLGSLGKTVIASLFHPGLHSGAIFCGKNDVICYSIEQQVMSFFGKTIFDQVPNKGFALLAAGQFVTRLQEFGLWGS